MGKRNFTWESSKKHGKDRELYWNDGMNRAMRRHRDKFLHIRDNGLRNIPYQKKEV